MRWPVGLNVADLSVVTVRLSAAGCFVKQGRNMRVNASQLFCCLIIGEYETVGEHTSEKSSKLLNQKYALVFPWDELLRFSLSCLIWNGKSTPQ